MKRKIDDENAEWARKFIGKKLELCPPYLWLNIVAAVVNLKEYADRGELDDQMAAGDTT